MNLKARIAKMEEAAEGRAYKMPVVHTYIQDIGQTREEACARYLQESGAVIGPDDLVIVDVIVQPPKWEDRQTIPGAGSPTGSEYAERT